MINDVGLEEAGIDGGGIFSRVPITADQDIVRS